MAKNEDKNEDVTLASVLARLVELQSQGQVVQQAALAQNAPKSLTLIPKISPYNWRGEKDYPAPRLKCEIFAPFSITPELQINSPQLTREEIELFNLLEQGDYVIELLDGTKTPVCVVGVKSQTTGKLESLGLFGAKDNATGHYTALYSRENRFAFPGLRVMLRQMLGDAASGVMTMEEELKRTQLTSDDPKHLSASVGA
jgi:hypothetical protein